MSEPEQQEQQQLWRAAERGDVAETRRVAALLSKEQINKGDNSNDWTALMHAARRGSKGVAEVLLEKGADCSAIDRGGKTALMYAANEGREEVMKMLLKEGADVHVTDNCGRTVLCHAASRGHMPVVETLLKEEADVHVADEEGTTVLMYAALNGHNKVAEVLLDKGADIHACDNLGWTALMYAANKSRKTVVELLLQRGADVYVTDKDGKTVSEFAKTKVVREVIHSFISSGKGLSTTSDIKEAVSVGMRRWGRSKIMLVGEGRAGKTGLANSIMGNKPFEDTESTVGIHDLALEVTYACPSNEVNGLEKGGEWELYSKPEKELETVIAQMVLERQKQQQQEEDCGSHIPVTGTKTNINGTTNLKKSASKAVENVPSATGQYVSILSEVDNNLVMKCLAQDIQQSPDLIVALYDYSGQSVFNCIHHLFLTTNGIYVVTFNMEWLMSEGDALQQCFDYLDFWVNSIIVHTMNHTTNSTAPVVFVGTHKDKVLDPADHEKISLLLYKRYSNSLIWPKVIENFLASGSKGRTHMYFFPVDNTLSRRDPVVIDLLEAMENVMHTSAFTNEMVLLTWLKTLDDIQCCKTPFLHLDDVYKIGGKYGVSETSIHDMLSFFNDRGIVLWLNENGLRDVVVLDAIEYFVDPSTIVICKHAPTDTDPTYHRMDVHKKCQKNLMSAWNELIDEGIVSESLLRGLWEKEVYAKEYDRMLQLMLKFGLIVSMTLTSSGCNRYLVPSLLNAVDLTLQGIEVSWTDDVYQSCLFFFTVDSNLASKITMSQSDLVSKGFLPSGFFERLLSKILLWCQSTSRYSKFSYDSVVVYRNMAILHFGSQRFRMSLCPRINSIRVDIEGQHPLAVHSTLVDIIDKSISECFQTLTCFTVLFHSGSGSDVLTISDELSQFTHPLHSSNEVSLQSFVIPMSHLSTAAAEGSTLMKSGAQKLFKSGEIQELYGRWLRIPEPLAKYMVFISYRWATVDCQVVSLAYDMFSNFTIGDHHGAIDVFLDKKRLQAGRRFDFDFVKALSQSCVLMPIVSENSLLNMNNPDVSIVDNVLLEWIVGLEMMEWHNRGLLISELKAIFPIALGKCTVDENEICSEDLLKSDTYRTLPAVVPIATLEHAQKLLSEIHPGITLSPGFMKQTIDVIVKSLLKYNGFMVWNHSPKRVIEELVIESRDVVRLNLSENQVTSTVHSSSELHQSDGSTEHTSPLMDFLRCDKNIKTRDLMDALLDDLGVYEEQDVLDLRDLKIVEQIVELIKPGRQVAFMRLMMAKSRVGASLNSEEDIDNFLHAITARKTTSQSPSR